MDDGLSQDNGCLNVVTTKCNTKNPSYIDQKSLRRSFGSLTADKKVSFNENVSVQLNFDQKNSRNQEITEFNLTGISALNYNN